jgi:hypothetical protein
MQWHPTKTVKVAPIQKRRCAYAHHEGPRYVPLSQFPTRQRKDRKNKVYYESYCLKCQKRRKKDWWASLTEEQRDRQRENQREWRRNLSPEQLQRIREETRDRNALWRRKRGMRPAVHKEPEPMLDRGPLAEYLQGLTNQGMSIAAIAEKVGVNSSRIKSAMREGKKQGEKVHSQDEIALEFVDRVLVSLGGPLSVYDLYPELRE